MSESSKNQAPQRWQAKTYELLSFQLTSEFVAVFAEPAADGLVDLYSHPIQAIGLAKITTQFLERRHGVQPWEYQPTEVATELVGLQLNEGYWHIVQQCDNFAGIAGIYDDINTATGELDCSRYRPLRCSQD